MRMRGVVGSAPCPLECAASGSDRGIDVQEAAMPMSSPRQLVNISVAAEYANVHPTTLRRWIAAGRLPAYRVGPRLLKIDLGELDQIVRRIPVT